MNKKYSLTYMSYVSDRTLSQAKQIIQKGGSLDEALKYLQRGGLLQSGGSLEHWLNLAPNYGFETTPEQIHELGAIYADSLTIEIPPAVLDQFRAEFRRDGPGFALAIERYFHLGGLDTDMDLLKSWVIQGAIIDRLNLSTY